MDALNRCRVFAGLAAVALLCLGCASSSRPTHKKMEWLSYDQVSRPVRRKLEMKPDQELAACGDLVYDGFLRTKRKPDDPFEEISIADGAANYYDRRTGELIASCGYWYCTRNSRFCDRYCPLKEWDCSGG